MAGPKKRRTPAVAARGTELTIVCTYPRPGAWGKLGTADGDAKEIAILQSGKWHPTTDDFLHVANVPNRGSKSAPTEIFEVKTVGEFLGAIMFKGGGDRKDATLARVNIIGHGSASLGKDTLIGLSGRIADNGDCFLNLSVPDDPADPNAPMSGGGFDESVTTWLDTTAKSVRDTARKKLRPDATLALILCNGGGTALSAIASRLIQQLANCFNVTTKGYNEEIDYQTTFDTVTKRIIERSNTAIGATSTQPHLPGYPCHVVVPTALAGTHLAFQVTKTPAKSTP